MTRPEAIRDLLVLFCGVAPPFPIKTNRIEDLSEAQYEKLVKHITLKSSLPWLTPVSVLDSIDNMIDAAVVDGQMQEHKPVSERRMKANHKPMSPTRISRLGAGNSKGLARLDH